MSDSGDPKQDKDRELRAQREFYEQDPIPSATTHNNQADEELRKEIVSSLSRAQVQNVDVMGEATIEREADHIMRAVSHHIKEAVERPTDLLRSALAIAKREEAEGCGKTNWPAFRKQLETYFAELSAPQQSTGGGDESL